MKNPGKRRLRYGKGKGKNWGSCGAKRKLESRAKLLEKDLKIIENAPKLNEFYLQRYLELTRSKTISRPRGRDSRSRKQMLAISLTKEFAEQNSIAWRL